MLFAYKVTQDVRTLYCDNLRVTKGDEYPIQQCRTKLTNIKSHDVKEQAKRKDLFFKCENIKELKVHKYGESQQLLQFTWVNQILKIYKTYVY